MTLMMQHDFDTTGMQTIPNLMPTNDQQVSSPWTSLNPSDVGQQAENVVAPVDSPKDHPFDHMDKVDLPSYVKEHDTQLTFPEKLMLMMIYVEKNFTTMGKPLQEAPIAWTMQGKAFVVRKRDEFVRHWLPLFFRQAKFPSFTRKLYRWGFRQISTTGRNNLETKREREMFFFNPDFQRDNKNLMTKMSSVTAETKRQQQRREASGEAVQPQGLPLTLAQFEASANNPNMQEPAVSPSPSYDMPCSSPGYPETPCSSQQWSLLNHGQGEQQCLNNLGNNMSNNAVVNQQNPSLMELAQQLVANSTIVDLPSQFSGQGASPTIQQQQEQEQHSPVQSFQPNPLYNLNLSSSQQQQHQQQQPPPLGLPQSALSFSNPDFPFETY